MGSFKYIVRVFQGQLYSIMIVRQLYKGQQLIRHFLPFSRAKRNPRKSQSAQRLGSTTAQRNIDEFNFMDSIESIQPGLTVAESAFFARVGQMNQSRDQNCLYLLRQREEEIFVKMSEGERCFDELRQLLSWKIRAGFRFRRWDDMIVDIENCIQALKYQKDQLDTAEELCLERYNQLCAIYIMNDHDKLFTLLETRVDQELKLKGRVTKPRNRDLPFGIAQYHQLQQQVSLIDINSPKYHRYCEMILLKATGMLVLGLRQRAMKMIVILLASPVSETIRAKSYTLMLTALAFPVKSTHRISQPLWQRLIELREIRPTDAAELAYSFITTEMCEQAIRKLIKHFHCIQLEQMPAELFSIYGKSIFLICENYYLEQKQKRFQGLFKLLQGSHNQKIRLHLRYLNLGRFIDQQSLQQAQAILQKHIQEEEAESTAEEGVYFYRSSQVDSDLIRTNILKMAETVYLLRNDCSRAEEYSNEQMMLKCSLGVYTTKQPEKQDLWEDDWRHAVQGRVPYYYCNLDLERFFGMESVIHI